MKIMDVDKGGAPPAKPLDSATVILLRQGPGGAVETFLMLRRKQSKSFMGAHVFPGGKLDGDDCSAGLAGCVRGMDGKRARELLNEPELSPDRALGLMLCVVRELFEEAGVLLASGKDGAPVDLADPVRARIKSCRRDVHCGDQSLAELARDEDISFALSELAPYSRWITPKLEKRRFDTRFFLVRLPEGQEAWHDDVELIDSLWISPGDALKKQQAGEIVLYPPTLVTLAELAGFTSIEQAFDAARSRPILPTAPMPFKDGDLFGVLLPHDPEYIDPNYKQPHRPGEISRVVMKDGRWTAATILDSLLR